MHFLLQGLLSDLLQRCDRLKQEIQHIKTLPQEIEDYRDGIVNQLSIVDVAIRTIQQDPDIDVPAFTKNFLHKYKRLTERVRALEGGPVLALSRFSEHDRLLTMISHKIASEVNYQAAPPLCAALSSHHYWTNPATNIIMVPPVEPLHLLGLSDLYHEIGHIIIFRNNLLDAFKVNIDQFFALEIKKVQKEAKPKEYRELLKHTASMWKQTWMLEFAADMIAAYLSGPAFGWANIRLCINLSNDLFASSMGMYHEHPADDARNEAICGMLALIGEKKSAIDGIRDKWNGFIALSGDSKPQDYELRFPPQIITELGRFIDQQCQKMNLKSYSQQKSVGSDFNFTQLLNTAWMEFNNSPATFADWELKRIEIIKKHFKLL
jgi:hypothetical protein